MDNRKIIYLDDAIDAIKALPDCPNGFSDTYDKAWIISVLEEVPEKPTGWIPVSERLPEEDYWTGATFQHYFHHSTYSAYVLMTVFNADDDETIIDYGHTVDGEWYSDTTDCFLPPEWKVLAWMPLPERYRGEEE